MLGQTVWCLVWLAVTIKADMGDYADYDNNDGEEPQWRRLDNDQDDVHLRRRNQQRVHRLDECVLYKSNDSYAATNSESYLDLGYYDIPSNRGFEIAFEVLPDRMNHNGPLFSIGTDEFEYYEWKTKAVKTQFLVVEFVYSALAMLLKALDVAHMYQLEIYKTYPNPYDIDDAVWHSIRAYRDDPAYGDSAAWHLHLDDLYTNVTVAARTDVDLQDRPAYLGGRPGFRSFQFRGIIRNLYIDGERVQLSGKATYGLTEVWHCSAPEVQKFIEEIKGGRRRMSPFRDRARPTASGSTVSPAPGGSRRLSFRRRRPTSSPGAV